MPIRILLYSVCLLMFCPMVALSAPQQPDLEKVTIAQWGQEKYLIYLPLYVAMEEGYLKAEGVEVSIKFTGNDDQTFAAVIQGSALFGIGDPIFAAISQERGFPAKVVALIVNGVANWGVTNRDDIEFIESPQGLANLRIGSFPSPSTTYTLVSELIEKNKEAFKGTKIVQAPIGSQLALLEAGSADIVMELEPAASIAESKGYKIVYSAPKFYGNFAFTGLTTIQDVIDKKGDLVQNVVNGIERAVVASHKDPAIPIRVAKKLFPNLDEKVVTAAVNRMLSDKTYPEHVLVDDRGWQRALQTRLTVGDLKKPQETNLTVDNQFALAAGRS